MERIAIVTDSNSGITQKEAKELGIRVLPMPFFINEKVHYEDIDLSQEEFYRCLEDGSSVSTSQPSPGDVMKLWDELLKEYEEIVHIPMSSGLSASCETAMGLARDYEGKVYVVNNQRISVTQMQATKDALEMAKAGLSAGQIKEILERESHESSIYLMVDTLKYLKKGGRITPAVAMIGTVLKIKPVLQIQGDKLDTYAKVRGPKQARKVIIDAIKNDLETRFAGKEMHMEIAYAHGAEGLDSFREEVKAAFPGYEIDEGELSLSIACHTGPGVLAVALSKKVDY
ncbi:MAG TPA: DegV family protein [Candidatus Egerieimonas intestinavium]|uniref:DegV family protein n=1 Tax=Candidatus Egerieimonas intestinavium TaxID=2840777 RepID=A0A9D1ELS4_9FIRM|nr:DegV family protein [Candidatus Egerieimonas intestinavium]